MKDKDVISAKERLNAKRAKKIGKQQREYIPYDWALIFQANGKNVSKTAKALGISRCTLIRYLKSDEELRNAFNNIKLNEYDDVRVALVKLALDGHFHAVRYYLDNAGCFNGFGSKADYSDGKDEEEIIILNSMTLEEDRRKRGF